MSKNTDHLFQKLYQPYLQVRSFQLFQKFDHFSHSTKLFILDIPGIQSYLHFENFSHRQKQI